MRALAKGENLALPNDRAGLVASGGALRLVPLDEFDRAMQAVLEPGGSLAGVASCTADRVELDLASAAAHMHRLLIVVAAAASGPPLAARPAAQMTLIDDGASVARYTHAGIADERALILGEVYRRGGQWKLRAVGQGYRGGLPELLAVHGAAPHDVRAPHDIPEPREVRAPQPPHIAYYSYGNARASAPEPPAGASPTIDPSLNAEHQMRILAGVFEDAARSTAGYRSAIEFADRRRERELAELLDDPRRRAADDPARADAMARFDALVMQATADHHRSVVALRQEIDQLRPRLAAPLAPWDSAVWGQGPSGAPGAGIRVGEVLLPEAPELTVPLAVPFPSGRAIWLDGADDDVTAMARGLLVRMLAARGAGQVRVRPVGAGAASVLSGVDGTGQPLTRWGLEVPGAGIGGQQDGPSVVAELAHRADLLEMARTAGVDALPPNLFPGHIVLLWNGQPALDPAGINALRALAMPMAQVSVLLLGADAAVAADAVDALRIIAGQEVGLTEGWVGLSWRFRPDPGPTDAQLARLRTLG